MVAQGSVTVVEHERPAVIGASRSHSFQVPYRAASAACGRAAIGAASSNLNRVSHRGARGTCERQAVIGVAPSNSSKRLPHRQCWW